MKEEFKPLANTPPKGLYHSIRFAIRLLLDLQVKSIFKELTVFISNSKGKLLDVGCGQSPYEFLVKTESLQYFGIDIVDADKFDYRNPQIVYFKDGIIPFEDNFFDSIICTEVFEHVVDYQTLAGEIYRVLKPGGKAFITTPWSARYHYIPYDYFRYTPSALEIIFSKFSERRIQSRGTDISSICAKIIVLFFRNIFVKNVKSILFVPLFLSLSPLLLIAILLGQLSLIIKLGSDSDPLGYSTFLTK